MKGVRGALMEHATGARIPEESDGLFPPAEAGGDVSPGEDRRTRTHGLLKARSLCSAKLLSILAAWAVSASNAAIRASASSFAIVSASL